MRPRLLLLPLCVSVCVKSVCRSLCQSAAKAPIPEKPRLISGTDHCALLVLLIQLSWLNYLPGQETHTYTRKRWGLVQGSYHSIHCCSSGTPHQLRLACCAGWPIKPSRKASGGRWVQTRCDKTEPGITSSYQEKNWSVCDWPNPLRNT